MYESSDSQFFRTNHIFQNKCESDIKAKATDKKVTSYVNAQLRSKF